VRRALLVLALAGLALPVAACGGPHALSRGQLASQADALCDVAAHQVAALPTPRTLPEAAVFAEAAAKALTDEVKQLRRLKAADADAPTMDRFVAGLQAALDAMTRAADAAHRGDRGQLAQALRDGRDGSQSAASTARTLGMTVCGRVVGPDEVG